MVREMTEELRLDVMSISNISTAGVGRRNYAVKSFYSAIKVEC